MTVVGQERQDNDPIPLECRSRVQVVFVVAAAFLLVGPPVGNVVFTLFVLMEPLLAVDASASVAIAGRTSSTLGLIFALGMPLSYLVGGGPALLCGLLAGLAQACGRRTRTDVLVIFAFVASVAAWALATHPVAPSFGDDAFVWLRTFSILVVPALICRRLTAGTVYRRPSPA